MPKKYDNEIARLERLINSGATSVTTDGLTTQFDVDLAKKRLAELLRLKGAGPKTVKRKTSTLDLSGCW